MKKLANSFLLLVLNLLDVINVVNNSLLDCSQSQVFSRSEYNGTIKFDSLNDWITCWFYITQNERVDHMNRITVLKFATFSMDGQMPNCRLESRVDVYTGCINHKLVATFCSSEIVPHDIYSMDGCIVLYVYSQLHIRFSATYRTYMRNDTSYLSASIGIIKSNGWPTSYVKANNNWVIDTSPNKAIVINAMEFDLDGSSATNCNSSLVDTLFIEGWGDGVSKSYMFCSQHGPFSISIPYSQANCTISYANMNTTRSGRRGFILGYVGYTEVDPCSNITCDAKTTLRCEVTDYGTTKCVCKTGYKPTEDGSWCQDPCSNITCDAKTTLRCEVTDYGTTKCVCKTGYKPTEDGSSCQDPCSNITCDAKTTLRCEVTDYGTTKCVCKTGYKPTEDGSSCQELIDLPSSSGGIPIIGLVILGLVVLTMFDGCKIYFNNRSQNPNAELMNDRGHVEMSTLVDATREERRASLIEPPPPDYHVAIAMPLASSSNLPRYEDL